ncbi:MAG: hypothetical protein ACTSRP_09325 [Candidatus Helarchaeota archaeon]
MKKKESESQEFNLWLMEEDKDVEWTETTVDLRPLKIKKGVKSENKLANKLSTAVTIIFNIAFYLLYISKIIKLYNIAVYSIVIFVYGVLFALKINDVENSILPESKKTTLYYYYAGAMIIAVFANDLLFEVHWLAELIGVKTFFVAVIVNLIVILGTMIFISSANWRFTAKIKFKSERAKKLSIAKSIITIIFCCIAIVYLITQIQIVGELENAAEQPPDVQTGFGSILYNAIIMTFIPPEAVSGQYGGAQSFTMTFEMLFYSQVSGFMLAFMVIGAFANIFVINISKSQALQSATTLLVVGVPMIIVISMFLGVIPPPSPFVKLFGSPAIASFVYTIAMLSVFIIYLSMIMVFSHAAEVFNPGEEE